jgi:hypothetical protein
MEHDSTELTAEEQRIFDEIARHADGNASHSFRGRWRQPRHRATRWRLTPRIAVLAGGAMLTGALWFGAVGIAAVGFVMLLLGLSSVIEDEVPERTVARLRRLRQPRNSIGRSDG